MLLTVFCLRRDRSELTFSLQVDADFELQNFRALCELESGIPAAESQIVFAEQPLTDNHRSLASYGLKDGDVVILQQVENAQAQPPAPFPGLPRIDFSSITVPGTSAQLSQSLQPPPPAPAPSPSRPLPPPELPSSPQGLDNPALLRAMLLANPHELSLLKERNPPLAEALLSGDLEKFTQVLVEQQQDRARREQERIRLFSADPFDLEAQAKIEEDIRQQNIEENMTIAMEEAPESFGQVVMLYINCKVNGHPVKAFVDSGAQMTIMSQACAERCNIMRLVDRRWAGIARGVGTQKIIGRVHLAQVQIEGDFLPCSFSILEEQPMDMLLGLDMLKRHQCSIDLKKNVLVIGTTGSQTAFLPEGELPECAKLAYGAGREDVRPEEMADQELAEALQKSAEEAENDTETTSLEAPSQPTSDGFKRPVCFPELGLKTNDNPASRSLDRSSSAPSVCSPLSGRAEPANPRAGKSLDSLLETAGSLPPASPLALAGAGAASAEHAGAGSHLGGSLPPQDIPAEMVASSCPPTEDIPGLEPQEMGGESSPRSASSEMDAPLPLEPMEQNKGSELLAPDFQMCGTPRKEEPSPGEQMEPLRTGDVSAEERLGEGEEKAGTSRAAEGRPEGAALAQLLGGDPSAPEASDPPVPGPAGGSAKDPGMELELYKPHDLPLPLGLPPAGGLTQPGNATVGRSREQDEDPSISLASALKELHRLLVVSAKHDFRAAWQEERCSSAAAPPDEPAPAEERQDMALSRLERPGLEAASLEAGTGMLEGPRFAGGREQEAPVAQGAPGCSRSLAAGPSGALGQQQGDGSLVVEARRLSSGRLPGCAASGQSSGPRVAQGAPSHSPEERGTSGSVSEADPPEPGPLPASLPGAHHSPLAPAADLDQIVGAGFTPQEAGEALEHAGGNADLALLILLARNIVVPT